MDVASGYSSKIVSLCLSQNDTPSSTGHQTTISSFKRLYNFLVKVFKDIHAITGRNLPQVLSEICSFTQSCALGITAHFTDEETEAQKLRKLRKLTGQPETSEPGFGLKHVLLQNLSCVCMLFCSLLLLHLNGRIPRFQLHSTVEKFYRLSLDLVLGSGLLKRYFTSGVPVREQGSSVLSCSGAGGV